MMIGRDSERTRVIGQRTELNL